MTGTRVLLGSGDPHAARRWLADAETLVLERAIPGTLPALTHARGLLLTAEGGTAQARAELERAIEDWDALGRRWEGTWARIDLARCHRRSNQRLEAGRVARLAREIATELGSPPLVEAAAELLRGGTQRAAEGDAWAPLTAREFAVARLVADGLTNVQIGDELGISPKTASAHVEHILAKLGVGRRAEIATWAATVRVLHSPPHGRDREK